MVIFVFLGSLHIQLTNFRPSPYHVFLRLQSYSKCISFVMIFQSLSCSPPVMLNSLKMFFRFPPLQVNNTWSITLKFKIHNRIFQIQPPPIPTNNSNSSLYFNINIVPTQPPSTHHNQFAPSPILILPAIALITLITPSTSHTPSVVVAPPMQSCFRNRRSSAVCYLFLRQPHRTRFHKSLRVTMINLCLVDDF